MYDAHVKTAEKATQEFYQELGLNYSIECAAALFRAAAEQWSLGITDEDILEERAEVFFNEIRMEM